ncbi:MAG: hypothetical protein AAFP19_10330, partial [Bacteroidota bacterium]
MRLFNYLLFLFLCHGLSQTVYAQSPPSVSGDLSICAGSTTTLTASGESGATFAWYDQASGGSPIANTASYTTPVINANTNYYVEQTTGSGTSDRRAISIYVSSIPSPNIPTNVQASPSEICVGSSTQLSADVDSANYQIV